MQNGKFNVILDAFWGSSGKGKVSGYLVDFFNATHVSSANLPNAGHSLRFSNSEVFVAKAIPTAAALKKYKGIGIKCFISPGSGFTWPQFIKEWQETGRPCVFVHPRVSIVTDDHKRRENEGNESTKHIASTMQGSGTALADKILRKADVVLTGTNPLNEVIEKLFETDQKVRELFLNDKSVVSEFLEKVVVLTAQEFRNFTHSALRNGHAWLHEGSQGYALSIDHGSHYPNCTSRNCSVQAAMDYMAVPPSLVGDVYLNLRSVPIRVGNVVENGVQKGFSGGFYPDCQELTWDQVAANAGMPSEEAAQLAERERTTVTKRIRRVCTFSYEGLADAVQTNGATKLAMNFIQYINWKDHGLKGGKEAFEKLSIESRRFIDKVEKVAGIPVVLIGTGALHSEMINLL